MRHRHTRSLIALWFTLAGVVAAPVIASEPVAAPPLQQTAALDPAVGPASTLDPGEMARGGLYIPGTVAGRVEAAPLLKTEIEVTVSGMVARITVRHVFRNPTRDWVEALYTFPLPEKAAVDRLRMIIGGRVVEGRIEERRQARETYEAAKSGGAKTSLIEQERPNIFTASLANIGPEEEVSVEIAFQQTLRYDDGRFQLRLPLVIGPRYLPPAPPVAGFGGAGWGVNTSAVPDGERITPPVRPAAAGPGNPVSLAIDLKPGFPLAEIASPTHQIAVTQREAGSSTIGLESEDVPADRDFVLEWRPREDQAPTAGLFTETVDGEVYALLMLMPPAVDDAAPKPRREVVFILDTSGSMFGPSLDQARQALHTALNRLSARDSFNIVEFNTRTRRLFPAARSAGPEAVAGAHAFLDGLEAEGGTDMMPALDAVLDGRRRAGPLRQMILLTDGAVGNESALLDRITDGLGDSRLFTIGIGSAPNGYFMTRAARAGRGTYTFINDPGNVAGRISTLLDKLERPALTDIRVAWPDGASLETWPDPVPDLYAGEPVVVAARLPRLGGEVTVAGVLAGRHWTARASLDGGMESPGVGALWAREKIASLMGSLSDGADVGWVRRQVVETALGHRLVSAYTSLVAVDTMASRPPELELEARAVPVNMPHGWDRRRVFGGHAYSTGGAAASIGLTRTATPAPLHMVLGLILGILGLAGLAWTRRRA